MSQTIDTQALHEWALRQSVELEDRLGDLYFLREMIRHAQRIPGPSSRLNDISNLAEKLGWQPTADHQHPLFN
ncbi:hypothetical protein ACQAYK_08945 [Acidithiobacillus sp. AC3]